MYRNTDYYYCTSRYLRCSTICKTFSIALYIFTFIPIPNYCRPYAQYITTVLQKPVRHRTSGIKTHSSIQNMFISSHENEHSFLNEAQRLVYRRPHRRTKRRLRDTRSVADSSLVHSSTLHSPAFLRPSHNCQKKHILVPLTFLQLLHIFALR